MNREWIKRIGREEGLKWHRMTRSAWSGFQRKVTQSFQGPSTERISQDIDYIDIIVLLSNEGSC